MRIAWFFREHKVVTGVILFDLLIIVVMIVMMVMKAGKTATVDIMTVPSIAKVKIGGGEYSSGAYKVRPGDYDVTVTADGFVTKTVPVSARDGEISKVWVYLAPEEGNLNYYAQHEEDWEDMRLLDDEEAQRVWKVLSIGEELPMDYVEKVFDDWGEVVSARDISISADNGERCESYYCLKVATIMDKNEDVVKKMLADKGFELSDYEVEWKVYDGGELDYEVLEKLNE